MYTKDVWEQKFRDRHMKLMNPEKSLCDNIAFLKKGTVLDLACGDGRNAIYLAQKGFNVTGIDFSEEALKRLRYFADERNLKISTKMMNLNDYGMLLKLKSFDNIIINHYKPEEQVMEVLPNLLNQKGTLVICGFGYRQQVNERISEHDIFKKDEFKDRFNNLNLIMHQDINDDSRGFFEVYIFEKN
jgi:2-polyprenyl-3-methyl-5-hydroxy-6-metoxy-1,4-benzoquinol methylase